MSQDLSSDLAALGALGDEAMANAACRLAEAMQAPLTTRLVEVLGQVAAELDDSLLALRAEVRLVGDDARVVVYDEAPVPDEVPERGDDLQADTEARVTLRLPAQLKAQVEAAAAREGVSANTYIVRALSQQVRGTRGAATRVGRRVSGYGRS